jgi:hypothetical protein
MTASGLGKTIVEAKRVKKLRIRTASREGAVVLPARLMLEVARSLPGDQASFAPRQ